jgi:hypothetical protein
MNMNKDHHGWKSDPQPHRPAYFKAASPSKGSVSRAFIVRVRDWPAGNCVVMTTSASKAKFQAWASAKEDGYELTFGMLSVHRLPEWDNGGLLEGRCYAEDFINTL